MLRNLDWHEIVEKIASLSTSELAKDEIFRINTCANPSEAERSFGAIDSAGLVLSTGVRPHMESIDLFSGWFSRLKKNAILKQLEIKDVRHFCFESLALSECLSMQSSDWATSISSELLDASEPLSAIDQLLTPSGDIRMDASEKLYQLSKEKEQLAKQIQNQLDRLVKDNQMETMLQDKYVTTREGRWVIPVKGGLKQFVPGVVHGSSQTKQTVFIEPEAIVPINNRLRQVEIDIEDEIERLLTELSNYLFGLSSEFLKAKSLLLETDIVLAKAQLTLLLGAKPCRFSNSVIQLNLLCHPLLKLNSKNPIPNSIELDQKKSILMLSGPNAGGKTVLLKSIGLAAQMARCGLPICAEAGSTIPFFEKIITGIGDSQNVGEDLSTFAAHLKILDTALKYSGLQNLVLLDEICGSTDPEEGSALARAFIEAYSKNNVYAIITSHLSALKMGWLEDGPVINGSLEFNTSVGKPTYKFINGIAGDSLALLTAKRVGIDAKIIDRATDFMSPLAKQKMNELVTIEKMKEKLQSIQSNYQEKLTLVEKKAEELEIKIAEFESRKERELQKTIAKAAAKIETEISEIKASDVLHRHRKLQDIKHNFPQIVKSNPEKTTSENKKTMTSVQDFAANFPPGSKVFVPTLNQDGIVQSLPNGKGEVLILSNSLRLQISWQELKPAAKSQNPTASLARRSGFAGIALQNEERSVDLRGKTIESAISQLETALDQSVIQQEDRIKVIHGHGQSDALKKSVRNFLSRSIYVKKWKAGSPESGGDGITWVEVGTL